MVLTNGHHTCSSADCAAALCCNSCKEDCAALWGKPGIPGRDKRPGKTAFPGVCSPEVKLKEIKTWLLLGTIVSNVNLSFALYKLVSIQMREATLFLSFTKARICKQRPGLYLPRNIHAHTNQDCLEHSVPKRELRSFYNLGCAYSACTKTLQTNINA